MPDRFAIANDLREIAALLALKGENRYRARAYEKGAEALEALGESLDQLVGERKLTSIPGVGSGLAAVIAEIHKTGRSEILESLRSESPAGAVELSKVPGLTPRRRAMI